MFWYDLLGVLAIAFGMIAILLFFLNLLGLFSSPEWLLALIVAIAIALGLNSWHSSIGRANTTIDTQVVQMEITKCDVTSVNVGRSGTRIKYCIVVGNEYLIDVSIDDYVKYNVGDTVLVEVTTKTVFDKTTESVVILSE